MEPKYVVFYSYDYKTKQHERYDALVLNSRELPEHDKPVLMVIHFRHNDIASHHALTGVDWADTIERTLDVPHKDDLGNQSFYWVESEAEQLKVKLEKAVKDMNDGIAILRKQLAETTEGRDKALQELADMGARKPSGADLDAVADESKVREITKGKSKKE